MGLSGTLAILCVFWIVLSGRLGHFHLSLGIIARAIAAHPSNDLLPEGKRRPKRHKHKSYRLFTIYQILVAGVHVTYVVLYPRMSMLMQPIP